MIHIIFVDFVFDAMKGKRKKKRWGFKNNSKANRDDTHKFYAIFKKINVEKEVRQGHGLSFKKKEIKNKGKNGYIRDIALGSGQNV